MHRPTGRPPRPRLVRWVVPAVAVVVVVLGMFKVSGSSVSLTGLGGDGGLVAGTARGIRSDEWIIRTPLLVRQDEAGLRQRSNVGMGTHDMGVLADLPTRSADILTRPHQLPYWVVDVERAVALEWWIAHAVMMLGAFALVWVLTRDARLAVLAGVLTEVSPVVHWWTGSQIGSCLGYGMLFATCLVIAARSPDTRRRTAWSALAGWLAACLFTVLYPAWVIPTVVAFLPVVLWAFWTGRGLRADLRRLFAVAVPSGLVAAVLVGWFSMRHGEAMRAIQATAYPGDRRYVGGTAQLLQLLSAPVNSRFVDVTSSAAVVNGTNVSEASGPLLLLLPAIIVCALLAVTRGVQSLKSCAPLAAVSIGGAVLLAWALLPVPRSLAFVVGLDRVSPARVALPLAAVSAVSLPLALAAIGSTTNALNRRIAAAATVVFLMANMWGVGQSTIGGGGVRDMRTLLTAVVLSVGLLLLLRQRLLVGAALVVLPMLTSVARINPVQRGLGPIVSSPAADAIEDRADADPTALWAYAGESIPGRSLLMAAGAPTLTGVSLYPDEAMWHLIDPADARRDIWNRYAHIRLAVLPQGDPTQILLPVPDVVQIKLDACGPDSDRLKIVYLVVDTPDEVPSCFEELERLPTAEGELVVSRRR